MHIRPKENRVHPGAYFKVLPFEIRTHSVDAVTEPLAATPEGTFTLYGDLKCSIQRVTGRESYDSFISVLKIKCWSSEGEPEFGEIEDEELRCLSSWMIERRIPANNGYSIIFQDEQYLICNRGSPSFLGEGARLRCYLRHLSEKLSALEERLKNKEEELKKLDQGQAETRKISDESQQLRKQISSLEDSLQREQYRFQNTAEAWLNKLKEDADADKPMGRVYLEQLLLDIRRTEQEFENIAPELIEDLRDQLESVKESVENKLKIETGDSRASSATVGVIDEEAIYDNIPIEDEDNEQI